jgi:hypothetical protein
MLRRSRHGKDKNRRSNEKLNHLVFEETSMDNLEGMRRRQGLRIGWLYINSLCRPASSAPGASSCFGCADFDFDMRGPILSFAADDLIGPTDAGGCEPAQP